MDHNEKVPVWILCCNGEPIGVYTTASLVEYSMALHSAEHCTGKHAVFMRVTDTKPEVSLV